MTKFRFTYKNIENAFEAMLNNSDYETWYELFDRETFEAEFAEFIGTTENELWKQRLLFSGIMRQQRNCKKFFCFLFVRKAARLAY